MDFCNFIKKFPGIYQLRRLRYRREFHYARWANLFDGVYPDFATAINHVPNTKPLGYDHEEPAKMYQERASQVYPTDYPVLFWLNKILIPAMKVFDLGGHIGVSCYAYGKYLSVIQNVRWQVCDVPAVVEAGKQLADKKNATSLTFTTETEEMEGTDILLASGSLQYLEYNISDLLKNLKLKPPHLLINLLPLHPEREFVTIQNIGTAFCPYRIFHQENFIRSLVALGYTLIDQWENAEKKCILPFQPTFSVQPYKGLYFRIKEQ